MLGASSDVGQDLSTIERVEAGAVEAGGRGAAVGAHREVASACRRRRRDLGTRSWRRRRRSSNRTARSGRRRRIGGRRHSTPGRRPGDRRRRRTRARWGGAGRRPARRWVRGRRPRRRPGSASRSACRTRRPTAGPTWRSRVTILLPSAEMSSRAMSSAARSRRRSRPVRRVPHHDEASGVAGDEHAAGAHGERADRAGSDDGLAGRRPGRAAGSGGRAGRRPSPRRGRRRPSPTAARRCRGRRGGRRVPAGWRSPRSYTSSPWPVRDRNDVPSSPNAYSPTVGNVPSQLGRADRTCCSVAVSSTLSAPRPPAGLEGQQCGDRCVLGVERSGGGEQPAGLGAVARWPRPAPRCRSPHVAGAPRRWLRRARARGRRRRTTSESPQPSGRPLLLARPRRRVPRSWRRAGARSRSVSTGW